VPRAPACVDDVCCRRTYYLTRRFAPHAQRWQLIVWTRQGLLLLLSSLSKRALHNRQLVGSVGDGFTVRYMAAAAALTILMGCWAMHLRHLPFYYRSQNQLESWLYASNVLLMLLATGYTALMQGASASADVRRTFESAMLCVLFGGCALAAVALAESLRSTRRTIGQVDMADVLAVAESRLDMRVRRRLADGSIRLLSCRWLLSDGSDHLLTRDPVTRAVVMRRCQELPPQAFLSPADAELLYMEGSRAVLVLTYPWRTVLHPDPEGVVLAQLRRHLSATNAHEAGLFWDYGSLPQEPCTMAERQRWSLACTAMLALYASIRGTSVLQARDVPTRAEWPRYEAELVVETDEVDDLARWLARFVHARVTVRGIFVHVCFDSAVAAASCLIELQSAGWRAIPSADEMPYHGRAWCVLEEGAAMVVVAHLHSAALQRPLPERYGRLQHGRPKLVDLSRTGEEPAMAAPAELLDEMLQRLDKARVRRSFELPIMKSMLMDFEWIVQTAIEQARRDPLLAATDPQNPISRSFTRAAWVPPRVGPRVLRFFQHQMIRLVHVPSRLLHGMQAPSREGPHVVHGCPSGINEQACQGRTPRCQTAGPPSSIATAHAGDGLELRNPSAADSGAGDERA